MPEADREQVPWGSCEKNFENIVIRTWIRRNYMDIVCDTAEIVAVELTCAAPSLLLSVLFYESYNKWCISPGVPRYAICCRHVLVYCSQAHPWQTCMYVFSLLQTTLHSPGMWGRVLGSVIFSFLQQCTVEVCCREILLSFCYNAFLSEVSGAPLATL